MRINRRLVLGSTLALGLVAGASAQGVVRARLKLERRAGWQNNCVKCIPGMLYGVDSPARVKLCDTVELSFEDNSSGRSSIPAGTYTAFERTDRTKPWMKDEATEWRLELEKVPGGRSAIQFHYGKDAGWSEGCIIVGRQNELICPSNACKFSDSPRDGVIALRDYVRSRLLSGSDRVQIEIV